MSARQARAHQVLRRRTVYIDGKLVRRHPIRIPNSVKSAAARAFGRLKTSTDTPPRANRRVNLVWKCRELRRDGAGRKALGLARAHGFMGRSLVTSLWSAGVMGIGVQKHVARAKALANYGDEP